MSGIAGIFNRDGRPVEPELLTRMTDCIAHRGPDGINHWLAGPVGLGHAMLWTTPESLNEHQPLLDETGHLCLVLDGRVDNREELISALEAKSFRLRTDTDAEIVLRAYQCWDEACPQKIIGDFAFVIWDGDKRQLFIARDPVGAKPFYYYSNNRKFIYGSELSQLFEEPSVPREPNEGMIGEYLAVDMVSLNETLYNGIFRLPPAHVLIVTPDRIYSKHYWDIDPNQEIRYRTDDEYADHLLEILKEAVKCRLRSHKSVGAYLSGGVDSSSIVCIAQLLYHEGVVENFGFETFSLIYPGLECDESDYINDVVEMWNLKSNAVCEQPVEASWYIEQTYRYKDFTGYPNGSQSNTLRALAREKGVPVLLTGYGGDEWLTGSSYHYADYLRGLRVGPFFRQVHTDFSEYGINHTSRRVLTYGLRPLVPQGMRQIIKRAIGYQADSVPPWIVPHFAAKIQLTKRLKQATADQQFSSLVKKNMYEILTAGWWCHGNELEERSSSWFGIEQRNPFKDRRVIEFAFALPVEQFWRRDQTKFILRQSMRNLLPESIRLRRTKAAFDHVFPNAFQGQGGAKIFDSLSSACAGWVDQEKVGEMYQQLAQAHKQGNSAAIPYIFPLWMIFGIDLWIKTNSLKSQIV
ncbi:MAG: asparagine synthase (glutamine-hydrolyzing) [Anaerolineae bacterium]|nr:asparagine synthase (glutamine-hydrolyzing) [Anaerolineae bacterium]